MTSKPLGDRRHGLPRTQPSSACVGEGLVAVQRGANGRGSGEEVGPASRLPGLQSNGARGCKPDLGKKTLEGRDPQGGAVNTPRRAKKQCGCAVDCRRTVAMKTVAEVTGRLPDSNC